MGKDPSSKRQARAEASTNNRGDLPYELLGRKFPLRDSSGNFSPGKTSFQDSKVFFLNDLDPGKRT